ncbi:MAG: hypothetical protein VZR95_06665 [Alphaproteobacteria bacterium]
MVEQIKERVKAWKRFYTQEAKHVNENSSCREIIMELGYCHSDKFYTSGLEKMKQAVRSIGAYSRDEQKFMETLPAYVTARCYLTYDDSRESFTEFINGNKMFSTCSAQDDDIPIREYSIVTDREDLWGLEIYFFRDSRYCVSLRHGVIRYVKELPADYDSKQ